MISETAKAHIHIGTSGWSYPDWKGIVYPRDHHLGELTYLSRFLDAVEINNTFYRPPSPKYCEKWLRDVRGNPDFRFTLKLWRRFTHERDTPWQADDVRAFRKAIAPLADSGKLGAMLIQFPWSFSRTDANADRLRRLAEVFAGLPLAVEVRHVSWHAPEAIALLREHGLNFCNIDQPGSRQSIGPTNISTGSLAYYRFHGRNAAKWFDRKAGRDERYDYLYSEQELGPWLRRIADMAARVEQIYVMANNHYRGQAFTNALQMKSALLDRPVAAPPALLDHYPALKRVARPESPGGSLFECC